MNRDLREVRVAILRELMTMTANVGGMDLARIDERTGLGEYGLESVALKMLADRIGERWWRLPRKSRARPPSNQPPEPHRWWLCLPPRRRRPERGTPGRSRSSG